MKRSYWTLLTATVMILLALQARAAVQVSPEPGQEPEKQAPPAVQPVPVGATEKLVAFKVGEVYLTASSGGHLDLGVKKIGSKESFTLIDLNGGELADGDEVRIQYVPGKGSGGGPGDLTKASFWVETPEGVTRKRQGDSFKIQHLGGSKFVFQTLKGKFVGRPAEGSVLGLADKQEDALIVDIIDLSHGVPKPPKAPKPAEPTQAAAPAPADSKPAAE